MGMIPRRKRGTTTDLTAIPIQHVMPKVLESIERSFANSGTDVIGIWPQLVVDVCGELSGNQIAQMTRPLSFVEGVLTVQVTNSTLYTLLVRQEQQRLLKALKARFKDLMILNIVFRMG